MDFATAELELAQALTDQVVGGGQRAGPGRPAARQGGTGERAGRGAGAPPDSRIDDGLLPPGSRPATWSRSWATSSTTRWTPPRGRRSGATGRPGDGHAPGRTGAELLLRVADTGAGVDPAHAEEVFRPGLERPNRRDRRRAARGRTAGLALVRAGACCGASGGAVAWTGRRDGGAAVSTVRHAACGPGERRGTTRPRPAPAREPARRRAGRLAETHRRSACSSSRTTRSPPTRTSCTWGGCPGSPPSARRTRAREARRAAGPYARRPAAPRPLPARRPRAAAGPLAAGGRAHART